MKSAYRKGVRLSITIAPKASAMLDHMLATGLFGRSRAELAQRMVYRGLRDELGPDGALRWQPQASGKKRKSRPAEPAIARRRAG